MEYRQKLNDLGIKLTHSGKQTCPICSETRKNKTDPCLSVTFSDEAVLYNCHNCDFHGAVYYRNKHETIKNYKKPEQPKTTGELKPLYDYFSKRGISSGTLKKYGVSLNEKKEIILPYYKNGELVNVKYRTDLSANKKGFRQESNTEKTLFGMDLIRDVDTLIWVEGEIDVLSLAENGIHSVSVPQGASEDKLECIENCFQFINEFKTHIIAVDNDATGDKLKLNLLNRLGKEKCKIVNWKQYKDANEALVDNQDLYQFIDSAEDIAPEGIINFADCYDLIYKYNFEKDVEFYNSGWPSFNRLVKVRTGRLMVVTGYPSRGKSTWVRNLQMNLTKNHGWKHLIASFEDDKETTYNTLLEMYLERPIWDLVKDEQVFGEPFYYIADHFLTFDVEKMWNVDEICERAELAAKKYGIKCLTIDPYNRLKNDYKDREDKYIGNILAKLSMLAKKLDILIIFVAHPKKPDGEKHPNMYSISGSADWYNMTDYGIIIHRDRLENGKLSDRPLIFVQKVKNFNLGNPSGGSTNLLYNSNKRILIDECA